MTRVSEAYAAAQESAVLVEAASDKIIRVLRVLFTGWGAMGVTLLSDPGGDGEQPLTAGLYVGAGVPLDLRFGREEGLLVERGKALGFASMFEGSEKEHSVTVWYETVG